MNIDKMEGQVTPTMERLSHKIQLLYDTTNMWKVISQNKACYPKPYLKAYMKSILKDTKKGLKEIDKKNGVYVEMPTLKSIADGQVQRVYEKPDDIGGDDIIDVQLPATAEYKQLTDKISHD